MVFHVRPFRAADCDTGHYLVVAKVRERLAVSKQTKHRFHMERFSVKKLKKVEVKEQYHVKKVNRVTTLENLDSELDINRAWKTIRENIQISAERTSGCYELKNHKPRFDKGC
jgi:hypothetical protein